MSALERLLPRKASNDYRGSPIACYAFCLLAVVMTGRSLIHLLKDDSGVNSIATIISFPGTPDPNLVIHLFSSLWGSQQVITVLIYGVVLLRYRVLIPLMYTLMIVEIGLRMVSGTIHPLTEEYFARTPPGKTAAIPLLVFCLIMLFLSLRVAKSESDERSLASHRTA